MRSFSELIKSSELTIKANSKDVHLPPFANATRLIIDKDIDQERD
jgi:hypothetical protein